MASGITPVWTTRRASMVTRRASEKTLRDLYADEFFVEEQQIADDNQVEEQHALAVLPNYCVQVEPITTCIRGKRHDSVMSNARPAFVAKPVQDMQHVCRPYSAQATTLLFDADVPYDSDEELALNNDFHSEATKETPAPESVQQTIERSPTPELLDTSDLKLQPIITGPLRDHVSEMLDFDIYEVQETASEYVPKREGRPLIYPMPLHTVAEDVEQEDLPMQELIFSSSDGIPCISDAECHSVLYQIPARPFLPGLEHLTHIESRAAFISYDHDFEALAQASVELLDDHLHFESPCLGDNVSDVLLPGENFLLITCSNQTDATFSMQYPSAESLLSLIDDLSDCEDPPHPAPRPGSAQLESPHVVDVPRPGDIFDACSLQFVGYMALEQVMAKFNVVSDSDSPHSDECDTDSDMSEDEDDELPMSQPSQLTYYDADSQQFTGYMAFNQLLMDINNDDSLSHVHREDENLGSDFASVDSVREIGDLRVANGATPSQGPVIQSQSHSPDYNIVDISYDPNCSEIQTSGTTTPRSIKTLQSFVRRQSSRRRPKWIIQTQLSDIGEDDSQAPCSPEAFDTISDFAECRGFVKPTSARRVNFLDDSDDDDDMDRPQSSPHSAGNTSLPGLEPSISAPASPVVEHVITLFDNEIWHQEVDLFIAMPLTPVDPCLPSADQFPPAEVLNSLETELFELMALLYFRLSSDQFTKALALGSDLQWALSAITGVYPRLRLMQRLSNTVEILLKRVVALGYGCSTSSSPMRQLHRGLWNLTCMSRNSE